MMEIWYRAYFMERTIHADFYFAKSAQKFSLILSSVRNAKIITVENALIGWKLDQINVRTGAEIPTINLPIDC